RFDCLAMKLRAEVDKIAFLDSLNIEPWRLGRNRLSRRGPFTGNVGLRNRGLGHWPDRLTGRAIQHVSECLLAGLNDDLPRSTVHCDIKKDRMRRHVVIPNVVVN